MVSLADACSAAREFSGRNRGHSTSLPAVAALRLTREEPLPRLVARLGGHLAHDDMRKVSGITFTHHHAGIDHIAGLNPCS